MEAAKECAEIESRIQRARQSVERNWRKRKENRGAISAHEQSMTAIKPQSVLLTAGQAAHHPDGVGPAQSPRERGGRAADNRPFRVFVSRSPRE